MQIICSRLVASLVASLVAASHLPREEEEQRVELHHGLAEEPNLVPLERDELRRAVLDVPGDSVRRVASEAIRGRSQSEERSDELV